MSAYIKTRWNIYILRRCKAGSFSLKKTSASGMYLFRTTLRHTLSRTPTFHLLTRINLNHTLHQHPRKQHNLNLDDMGWTRIWGLWGVHLAPWIRAGFELVVIRFRWWCSIHKYIFIWVDNGWTYIYAKKKQREITLGFFSKCRILKNKSWLRKYSVFSLSYGGKEVQLSTRNTEIFLGRK